MKKRIVKALNNLHEIVYVIEIRHTFLFLHYWVTYKKSTWNPARNYWEKTPIEFTTIEKAQEVMRSLEDIKRILL